MLPPAQPQDASNELLAGFNSYVKSWQRQVQLGLEALRTFQQGLIQLQPPISETPAVYNKLMELAPSFKLEQYIEAATHPIISGSPQLATSLQQAYVQLHECMIHAEQITHQLAELAEQQLQLALAAQLQLPTLQLQPSYPNHLQPTDTSSTALADAESSRAESTEQSQQLPVSTSSHGDNILKHSANAGTAAPAAATAIASTDSANSAYDTSAAGVSSAWSQEEAALMMSAVSDAISKEASWMSQVVSAISLDMPLPELDSYLTLWELQPYTDHDAWGALLECAAQQQQQQQQAG
eukprot:jgi/Chrzof1/12372/Cz06g32030.t1